MECTDSLRETVNDINFKIRISAQQKRSSTTIVVARKLYFKIYDYFTSLGYKIENIGGFTITKKGWRKRIIDKKYGEILKVKISW